MKHFIPLLALLSLSAQAYDCKATKVTTTAKAELEKMSNQAVFEGLLHELTNPEFPKSPKNALAFTEYLVEKEQDKNQNAMIKLLAYTSDLKTEKPKSLDLKEVCEVVTKVNTLPPEKKK